MGVIDAVHLLAVMGGYKLLFGNSYGYTGRIRSEKISIRGKIAGGVIDYGKPIIERKFLFIKINQRGIPVYRWNRELVTSDALKIMRIAREHKMVLGFMFARSPLYLVRYANPKDDYAKAIPGEILDTEVSGNISIILNGARINSIDDVFKSKTEIEYIHYSMISDKGMVMLFVGPRNYKL